MNTKKMGLTSRLIIAVASVCLIATFFLPVWFIFLLAPQYPEGLTMNIWLNKITGQVDIINGLNHYIGMKHISADMFPEFKFLVYIVAFFILFGLVVAVTGKRKLLFAYLLLTVAGGAAALYDFYQWGYNYGHHLDPKAAIQVPGLYYQPPLIGHKRLLNFDAYSYPDIGGWIVIGVGLVFFLVWFFEWYKNGKKKFTLPSISPKPMHAVTALFLVLLTSCATGPEKVNFGKDVCADCNMAIMEAQYVTEIVTKKGKVFKFDDAHCMRHFIANEKIEKKNIAKILLVDFTNHEQFIESAAVTLVTSPELKSPMNGNTIAFADRQVAEKKAIEIHGELTSWNAILETEIKNKN
jgi:copper chaperone NosL